ncbi:MAG: hypothetical protein WC223_13080 [Bacteroidales bacterium]|jgi:hypothetical protein
MKIKKSIREYEGKDFEQFKKQIEKQLKRKILMNLEGYKMNLEYIIRMIENI